MAMGHSDLLLIVARAQQEADEKYIAIYGVVQQAETLGRYSAIQAAGIGQASKMLKHNSQQFQTV